MLSFEDIPESGIFDSTFTGVEGGSLRADMRDPAGVAFRTRAPVLEYTTEGGHVVPQPTGLGATVSLSICPLVIWENNPRFCDPPLQIDKVTPDPHRENVALADPGGQQTVSEPVADRVGVTEAERLLFKEQEWLVAALLRPPPDQSREDALTHLRVQNIGIRHDTPPEVSCHHRHR